MTCKICSGSTQWDDGANSFVCVDCGSLEDASQTVLADNADFMAGSSRSDIILNPVGNSTLRTSAGRPLYGQPSKDKQHASHVREMRQFISSTLQAISQPGLMERTCHLFDLAMQRAKYRWGRQAKLAASACIAIALNESKKGVTMATLSASAFNLEGRRSAKSFQDNNF